MRREALVVGINPYPFFEQGNLKAPATDAEDLAQLLEKYGDFKVTRLPGFCREGKWEVPQDPLLAQVKQADLQKAIANLFHPPDGKYPDIALFYFAGHGWKLEEGKGFLCTSDTCPTEEDYGLPLEWLRSQLETSPVRQQIVWLDCCYSGELFNFQERTELENPRNVDRCLIAASRSFQQAWEFKRGLLSGILLEGLNPTKYVDGWVSNYNLAKYIDRHFANAPQHPIIRNQGKKAIILTTKQTLANTGVCPYRSLNYFTDKQEDAAVFYGREALTDKLIEQVKDNNFVVVIGASGSGKSSLLRAGLLYQLKLGQKIPGSDRWHYFPVLTPGEQPVDTLSHHLDIEENKLNNSVDEERIVLMIDQFEECFTMCADSAQRQAFFDLLGQTLAANDKICLVVGIRADFWGKLAEYEKIASRIDERKNLTLVKPLSRQEIEAVITKPAEQVGLQVEGKLITKLIEDVIRYPGSLPLLEYSLTELWEKDRNSNFLMLHSYNELGGIEGTLQTRADRIFERLSDREKNVAKRIFLELTQIGEAIGTRRRVRLENLVNDRHSQELLSQTVEKLVKDRLIVCSEENLDTSQNSQVILDLVHEALIRHWGKLKQWIEDNLAAIKIERKIEAQAQEWQQKGKPPGLLLQGMNLTEAELYLQKHEELGFLDGIAQEFINKSLQKRRKNRLQRIGSVALTILILSGASIFSFIQAKIANEQKKEAEKQTKIANLRAKAIQAENLIPINPVKGLVMAMAAIGERSKNQLEAELPRVHFSLSEITELVRETLTMKGHTASVWGVAFSPDGQTIASTSADGTVRLWERSGKELAVFQGHTDWVWGVAFSPDGQTIASTSADGTVRLWERSGKELAVFQGHTASVIGVAFSPDGQTIASTSADGTVRLWERSGKELAVFQGHTDSVIGVAFSPDGQTIASTSEDRTVRLWERSGKELAVFQGHTDWVWGVAFSPDGQTIASTSADGTVRLWERSGKELAVFQGHTASVIGVAFSPDGQTIASTSADGTVRLWERSGKELAVFQGHTDSVIGVAFSPDGQTIASTSEDRTVRLWERSGKELAVFQGHTALVWGVAFSPDGQTIASTSEDGTVRLWERSGKELAVFQGHTASVWGVAFSPDGQTIASTSDDRTVRLWDPSGKELAVFQGHTSWVWGVAFSPDGQTIASTSEDRTVRLWDPSGKELAVFQGHTSSVWGVAFSPDGQTIASTSADGTVRLWERSGKELAVFQGHTDSVIGVAFSPDGQTIASTSADGTVRLWERSGKELAVFQGHTDSVWGVAFSPDGQTIASASADGTVRLWERSGKELAVFQGHTDRVWGVAFSPDGQTIASASNDNTVRLWTGNWQNLLSRACHKLRYNPILLEVKTEDAKTAGDTCLEYSYWNERTKAEFQRDRGLGIASTGDYQQGAIELKAAQKRESKIDLNPRTKELETDPDTVAEKLAAPAIVEEAIDLAKEAKIEEAIALLKQAQTFSPEIDLDPNTEEVETDPETVAKLLAAPAIVQDAIDLAKEAKIEEAIALLKQAQTFSPEIDLDPNTEEVDQDPETVAKLLAAPAIVQDAIDLARRRKIEEAIELFKKAQTFSPDIDLDPRTKELDGDPEAVAKKLAPKSN